MHIHMDLYLQIVLKNIPIYLITSTDAKISTIIDEKHLELGARALPAASMQLIRINGDGVKPMPAITDALDRAQVQRDAEQT